MGVVFKEEGLQSTFEKDGYVIVDFLNLAQAKQLLKNYEELVTKTKNHSNSPINSHETEISIFNTDKTFTKEVHNDIINSFKSTTDRLLNDYTPIMGNMVYKNPFEKKDFSLHQDWRFSDENENTTINIWCPLVDTSIENGTLHIIKRSHLFQEKTIRGANIGDASNKISEFITSHFGTSIRLKVGQAVILNTQLYHFSPPNTSSTARPVALLAMLPKKAKMYFYYKNPLINLEKNIIEQYEINADFMTSYHLERAPKGVKKIQDIEYNIDYFTKKSFSDLYRKYNNELPKSVYYKNNKRIVFNDKATQLEFEKEGFIKINLLEKEEIVELRNKYESLSLKLKGNLQMISIYDENKEFTSSVHQEVSSLFESKLKNLLFEYKSIIGYFVYKNPSEEMDLEMHQDASFSDENLYTTINIWCPLVDTDIINGTLQIIKKSHLFAPSIRGFKIGYAADKIRGFVKKYFATSLTMKAGQAIIMNTQLYHFSPPNQTEIARPAAVLAMLPKEAPTYIYYNHSKQTDKPNIEQFEIEDGFLVKKFNIQETPKNQKSLGIVDYQINYFTEKSFMALYKKHNKSVPIKARTSVFFSSALNLIKK